MYPLLKKMVILHISAISGKKSSGMSVVVPEHVISQSKIENVAFLNCRNIKLTKLSEFKNYFCQEKNIIIPQNIKKCIYQLRKARKCGIIK